MNRREYRRDFPQVAAALDELIFNDKKTHKNIHSRYVGLPDKGVPRKLSLGVAISYLIDNGYEVDIAVALKGLPKIVVKRGRPRKIKAI